MREKETKTACPKCGARDSIPISYGYPGPEMMEASKDGRIELGGCVIYPDQPNRACRACHHRWRQARSGTTYTANTRRH